MPNGTDIQRKLIEGLRTLDPELEVTWSAEANIVSHLSGTLSQPREEEPERIARDFLLENQALFGIENAEDELVFRRVKTDQYGWHHVTFQQQFQGVSVWSAMVLVHIDDQGVVRVVNCKYEPEIKVDPSPAVDPQRAVEISWKHAELEEPVEPEDSPYNVVYTHEGETHLAWVLTIPGWDWSMDGYAREPARWEYFIDAHDGTVIARFNLVKTHTATTGKGLSVHNPPHLKETNKTLQTYHHHVKKTYQLHDNTRQSADKVDILTYDANGAFYASGSLSEDKNNNWNNKTGWNSTDHSKRIQYQPAEVDAHDHAAKVYDYYKKTFGRVGIDDNFKGPGTAIDIKSYVHLRTQDTKGKTIAWNNAAWTGSVMIYGDGQYNGLDGDYGDKTFYSGALDIVAHELTHGVTDYEITDAKGKPHGFTYKNEPGAANESFSDVFAAFVDRDWRQGDKIVVGSLTAPGKMWRDLSNPTRGLNYNPKDTIPNFLAKGVPQPDHYDIRYQGTGDYGGVHINSGILNFAAYLATHGGVSHRTGRKPVDIPVYRSDRQGIGWKRAEQIYYLALTAYFVDSPGKGDKLDATFLDVRKALLDACNQLAKAKKHGVDKCDWRTLRTAFYAVGVHPAGENYGPDPMIIPWGIWTGTGAPYQSPDIWVEDQAGKKVNAEKGIKNRLFAQVRNIGDQTAKGVKIRFSYSPFGMGYHHKDFKQITEKTVDIAAGEIKKVEVSWDLTNLNENHGGKWPSPINKFKHFCARVEIIGNSGKDVNPCNNMAQNNFVNVGTHKPAVIETAMIVANPSEEFPAEVEIVLDTTLPETWEVWFDDIVPEEHIALEPDEKRLIQCYIQVPDEPLIRPPINGYLEGSLSGLMPGEIEGRLEEVTHTEDEIGFQGKVTGTIRVERPGEFRGEIEGRILDQETGDFIAQVRLIIVEFETRQPFELSGTLRGRLIPERRVSISERINGEVVGGVDLNLRPEEIEEVRDIVKDLKELNKALEQVIERAERIAAEEKAAGEGPSEEV